MPGRTAGYRSKSNYKGTSKSKLQFIKEEELDPTEELYLEMIG